MITFMLQDLKLLFSFTESYKYTRTKHEPIVKYHTMDHVASSSSKSVGLFYSCF